MLESERDAYPSTEGSLRRFDESICSFILDPDSYENGHVPLGECPKDPSGEPAFYGYKSSGESFELSAALEDPGCLWSNDIISTSVGMPLGDDLCLYIVEGKEF